MTSVDCWTLGYAVVTVATFVWRMPYERIPALLAIHLLLAVLVLLMPRARRAGSVGRFLGNWYPLLIVTALYTEVGLVNLGDGRAYDRIVLGWEQALFGFQPAREWIRANPSAWLSWVLYLGYLAYYPIIAAAPVALWAAGQHEAMRRAITTIITTFYLCYTVFLLFPVVGPRHVFPATDNIATRTMIAQLTARFLDHVAAWGAAFPSSHVAVSVARRVNAYSEWRAIVVVILCKRMLM